MRNFLNLKAFRVNANNPKPKAIIEVIWHPPPRYVWIKYNTNGAALGAPGFKITQILNTTFTLTLLF